MDEQDLINEQSAIPSGSPAAGTPDPEAVKKQRRAIIGIIAAVVVLLSLLVLGVIFLAQDAGRTAVIRDIFIIFMALETLLIGFTLVILIVQLARLINLLQNEIKPILDSTNETVSTMRGTATFLSDNLAEPVVKLNETFAAFGEVRKFIKTLRGK